MELQEKEPKQISIYESYLEGTQIKNVYINCRLKTI